MQRPPREKWITTDLQSLQVLARWAEPDGITFSEFGHRLQDVALRDGRKDSINFLIRRGLVQVCEVRNTTGRLLGGRIGRPKQLIRLTEKGWKTCRELVGAGFPEFDRRIRPPAGPEPKTRHKPVYIPPEGEIIKPGETSGKRD